MAGEVSASGYQDAPLQRKLQNTTDCQKDSPVLFCNLLWFLVPVMRLFGVNTMRMLAYSLLILLFVAVLPATGRAAGQTELTWYGHAAFKVVTPKGHVLLIDPLFINQMNPDGQKDLDSLTKADLILISHGHFDHVGNANEIARKTGARLVATYDLANAMATYGGYPKDQMGYDTFGNFGGTLRFFDGEVTIAFIPAVHSSSVNPKDLKVGSQADQPEFGGNPSGFLVMIEDGPAIYHTGDTDLFSDMTLIPHFRQVDVMLACIGDHFTMGPGRAAEAVALVQPNMVVPMHYGIPDVLSGTVEDFERALHQKQLGRRLLPMSVKKPLVFNGAAPILSK